MCVYGAKHHSAHLVCMWMLLPLRIHVGRLGGIKWHERAGSGACLQPAVFAHARGEYNAARGVVCRKHKPVAGVHQEIAARHAPRRDGAELLKGAFEWWSTQGRNDREGM